MADKNEQEARVFGLPSLNAVDVKSFIGHTDEVRAVRGTAIICRPYG